MGNDSSKSDESAPPTAEYVPTEFAYPPQDVAGPPQPPGCNEIFFSLSLMKILKTIFCIETFC